MLPSYPDLNFPGNTDLTRLQDTVAKSLRRILGVGLLDGVLIQGIVLQASAPTLVAHGLPRSVVGWLMVDITAPAKVYRVPSSTQAYPSSILPLQADATTTVAVWVF